MTALVLVAGLVVSAGACTSSQRVRLRPDETLPPLPPTVSVRPRPTTTVAVEPTYVVRQGDTLGVIAARLGLDPVDIVALNSIVDPNRLETGQVLRLPPTVTVPTTLVRATAGQITTPATKG